MSTDRRVEVGSIAATSNGGIAPQKNNAQLSHLRAELEANIDKFEEDSNRHKNSFRRLRYTTLALTAVTTILAGLAIGIPQAQTAINIGIVVVTALLGFLTAIEGLRKPGKLWVHERTTHHTLKDLKREVEFRASAGGRVPVTDYFERLQSILGASRDNWRDHVARPALGHGHQADDSGNSE